MDPIIEYKNLLNKHGDPEAAKVKEYFTTRAANDKTFEKRAGVLNELFLLKQQLISTK